MLGRQRQCNRPCASRPAYLRDLLRLDGHGCFPRYVRDLLGDQCRRFTGDVSDAIVEFRRGSKAFQVGQPVDDAQEPEALKQAKVSIDWIADQWYAQHKIGNDRNQFHETGRMNLELRKERIRHSGEGASSHTVAGGPLMDLSSTYFTRDASWMNILRILVKRYISSDSVDMLRATFARTLTIADVRSLESMTRNLYGVHRSTHVWEVPSGR